MSLDVMKQRLEEIKSHVQTKKGEIFILNNQIETTKSKRDKLISKNERLLIKKELIEQSCSEARANGAELFSQVTTSSIQSVFGENTRVNITLDKDDGIPTANLDVINETQAGVSVIDPANSDGGGLADVVSLSTFVSLGNTTKENFAPYVLDEPTKFVSKGDLAKKCSQFIVDMITYVDKQTIISTHDDCLLDVGDVRYHITKDEAIGISEVQKIY